MLSGVMAVMPGDRTPAGWWLGKVNFVEFVEADNFDPLVLEMEDHAAIALRVPLSSCHLKRFATDDDFLSRLNKLCLHCHGLGWLYSVCWCVASCNWEDNTESRRHVHNIFQQIHFVLRSSVSPWFSMTSRQPCASAMDCQSWRRETIVAPPVMWRSSGVSFGFAHSQKPGLCLRRRMVFMLLVEIQRPCNARNPPNPVPCIRQ